ncbi:putative non-specific serine/threonine protein kinase [Helianthus anomalus]
MQRLNMILFYCCGLLIILITDGASGAATNDTIFPNQTLKDGDTIVSAGEIFELGFFSPGNSSMRYLHGPPIRRSIATPQASLAP